MSQRILVTGGSGYLGARMLSFLRREQYSLLGGFRSPASVPHVLRDLPSISLDFRDLEGVQKVDLSGLDTIIHLAGLNEKQSEEDPALSEKTDVQGVQALLGSAIRAKVRRFIYVSTIHVYGAALKGDVTEMTSPVPLTVYARARLSAEAAVFAARRSGQISGVVLRSSNVLGAPLDPEANCWMLLPHHLARQAVIEGRMTLKSTGTQQRDFLSMQDFCSAVLFFVRAESDVIGNGLFNLGSGRSRTIAETADEIKRIASTLLGREIALSKPSSDTNEPAPPLNYDIQKLRAAGFSPSAPLASSIEELVRFCMKSFRV